MDEIVPGILHWTTFNEQIGQSVHSHLHTPSGAIFDPRLPEAAPSLGGDESASAAPGALEGLSDAVLPTMVLLSSRHHTRHSGAIAAEYEIPIRVSEPGARDFDDEDQPTVGTFAFGEEVAPGVVALELPALAPDETVFRIDGGASGAPTALLFGDSLITQDGELSYVPDSLMGDDPAAVKRGLTEGLGRILEEVDDFDVLLFAHGAPVRSGGRRALEAFVADRADEDRAGTADAA